MRRQPARQMKRAIAAGTSPNALPGTQLLARESALHLLERSIGFGHGRLAVIRLLIAVSAGADISDPHWRYCRDIATNSSDPALRSLFLQAADKVASKAESHH